MQCQSVSQSVSELVSPSICQSVSFSAIYIKYSHNTTCHVLDDHVEKNDILTHRCGSKVRDCLKMSLLILYEFEQID